MNKTLVAYFSATGVTARIAAIIAEIAKSDIFEIRPVEPYTNHDLDWNDKTSRSTLEMNDKNCRPGIANKIADMGEYKTIFLGFPIWWYTTPRIIETFLESYNFAGKILIPFVTSGGSGLGNIPRTLEQICPAGHWLPGIRFAANADREEIAAFVKEHTDWKA